jgi:hypothetical protein
MGNIIITCCINLQNKIATGTFDMNRDYNTYLMLKSYYVSYISSGFTR